VCRAAAGGFSPAATPPFCSLFLPGKTQDHKWSKLNIKINVGDPDVYRPPGSGSGSGSFPILQNSKILAKK
jgi:hypothetical protein